MTRLRRWLLAISMSSAVWCAVLGVSGGFSVTVVGHVLRAHGTRRVLFIAVAALVGSLLLDRFAHHRSAKPLGERPARDARLKPSRYIVALLALGVAAIGVMYGAKVAGGADSWGYLSEAELWLSGNLKVDQSFVKDVPWPNARESFAPLAYRPGPPDAEWTIVPVVPPGLPLMLAAAQSLGGRGAMFWIVPLFAALLVWLTFVAGQQLASLGAALIGAALVATSPTVLFMDIIVMSDVPAAALWLASWCLAGGTTVAASITAGVAAGVAATVRPNLLPLALVIGLRYAYGLLDAGTRSRALVRCALFAAGLAPFMLFLGVVNRTLYGSPLVFGYGAADSLWSIASILPNLRQYVGWLAETHTSLMLAGIAVVFLPVRGLWPAARPGAVASLRIFVGLNWLIYLGYGVFDSPWYLRFLLPTWPFMMLGIGALAMRVMRDRPAVSRAAVWLVALAFVCNNFRLAADAALFEIWKGERDYPAAARLVQRLTGANSVVFSVQHSGSVRYYGGRMTLRYDAIDAASIDAAIDWMRQRGAHSYLFIDRAEMALVERQWAGTRAVGALQRPPLAMYGAQPAKTLLFDLSDPPDRSVSPVTASAVELGMAGPLPGPPPALEWTR